MAPSCPTLPGSLQATPLGTTCQSRAPQAPARTPAWLDRGFKAFCLGPWLGGGAQRKEAWCPHPMQHGLGLSRAIPASRPASGSGRRGRASGSRCVQKHPPGRAHLPSSEPGWEEAAVACCSAQALVQHFGWGAGFSCGPTRAFPFGFGRPAARPHPWQQCLCPSQGGLGKTAPQHPSRPGLPSPRENSLWIEGDKLDFMTLTGAAGGAGPQPEPPDHTAHFSKETEGQAWGQGRPLE
ncbi:hypothetical protein P7K49_019276 [Saguinus oedipus]|uniref:Uncharacterized protein n=1 Tax=Saguinus oedipus TaxID=9490 RepID=A0ABQ9UXZ8_SAGOE|nr:hypothetical protein P7K49_019276 [Saguinus oedipus]